MAEITCFVQTTMVGMAYGDVVTLEHTPYVDVLIAGGRLVPQDSPVYLAMVETTTDQPPAFDLLDTAVSAASPEVAVTPASAALSDPVVAPVDPAPADPAPAPADPAVTA